MEIEERNLNNKMSLFVFVQIRNQHNTHLTSDNMKCCPSGNFTNITMNQNLMKKQPSRCFLFSEIEFNNKKIMRV